MKDSIEKADALRGQQAEHLNELRARMDKLVQIAGHYGLEEPEQHEEQREQHDKLVKEMAALEKQRRIVVAALENGGKRHEAGMAEKRKEHDALYLKKATILKSYNERCKQLRLRALEIAELIARAKGEGAADRGLLEILNKWEEANLKLFEQDEGLDEEAQELSLLEAAHLELNKAK